MVASIGMYKVVFGALPGLQLDLPAVVSAGSPGIANSTTPLHLGT